MKCKAWATAAIAAAVLSAAPVAAEAPYKDIAGLAERNAVDYLYDVQCLVFAAGDSFLPDKVMTRGETAQLIFSAAANISLDDAEFTDVAPGRAGDAIAALSAQGILSGYKDGSFQPDKEVTREEFAGIIYQYLQYCHMADMDGAVETYADEDSISEGELRAVQVLHSKNIMVPEDGLFRPKDGITRREAAKAVYQLIRSDDEYISHVQIQQQVMKCLDAEYGSTLTYFTRGTMYWDGDTLVLGIKGKPGRFLTSRIKDTVSRPDAVSIRRVSLSRSDYERMLNRAVNTLVQFEGVQNYIGAVPDYIHEQIVVTVRRPVSEQTLQELTKRIRAGAVRIETIAAPGKPVQVQENISDGVGSAKERRERRDDAPNYSPLVDQATSRAIASVENDVM